MLTSPFPFFLLLFQLTLKFKTPLPSSLHLLENFTILLPWSRSLSRGTQGLLNMGICTCTLKYLLTSTNRVDTDWRNTINLYNFSELRLDFNFEWTERRELRNGELFTFYSTRALLLLFTIVTSVTCGLNRHKLTITVNMRWRIGRWVSDQMDHSVCALRWQVWWLLRGLSIKIRSSMCIFHSERQKTEQNTNAVQDPQLVNWSPSDNQMSELLIE